jgi:hypothetical protein
VIVFAVVTLSLVTAGLGAGVSLRKAQPGRVELATAALTSVAALVQSGIAAWRLIVGERPPETATAVGYLIGLVFVMPLGTAWALAEREKYSGYVIAVAGLTVAVMTARLVMLMRVG